MNNKLNCFSGFIIVFSVDIGKDLLYLYFRT